jgi:AraC-like DNA-binding protein
MTGVNKFLSDEKIKFTIMKQAPIIPLLKFANADFPFKIQTIKDVAEQAEEICDGGHSHDYYEIIWVINGKGTLSVDLQEYAIDNNMIFCLKPHQPHRFPMDTTMDGFVFSFTDAFFNLGEHEFDNSFQSTLYQLFNECRPIAMQKAIVGEIRDISQKMLKEYENDYPFRTLLLNRYFKIFLILLNRHLEESVEGINQTREIELVNRFMEILDKNFREEKMVSTYAAQFGVTANYLNRIVKKITGYSAGHHIRQRVVLEAKRMARYSDLGMKGIGYELGFLDSAHFSRFFKSFAGTNFTDFKRDTSNVSIGHSFNRA